MQVPKSGTVVFYPHKIAASYRGSLLMLRKSDRSESVQYSINGLHRIGGTRVSLSCQLPGEVILYPDYRMPASLPLDQIAFEDALAWFSSQQMAALTAGYRLMFYQGTSGSYQEDVTINGMSYKAVLGQIEPQNLWFHMLTKPDGFKIAMRLAQLTRNASITQGTLSIYSHFAGNLMNHLGKIENAIIAPLTLGFTFFGRGFESNHEKMEAQYEYYGKRFNGLNQIHLITPLEVDIHTFEGLISPEVHDALIAWYSSREMAAITSTLIFNFARKHGTWINERLSVNGIPFTVSIGTENKSWIHRLSIGERPIAQAVIDFPARKEDDASIVLHFRNYAGEIAKQLERHFDQHR